MILSPYLEKALHQIVEFIKKDGDYKFEISDIKLLTEPCIGDWNGLIVDVPQLVGAPLAVSDQFTCCPGGAGEIMLA